ncbi:hydantoin utilization protein B [Fervidicella metallireducens AeB]|uniref:Hydantoin utilization protein B n=1 Tax=Fervidicella metallireducens AeB TaxID=1403537 RepID=A0A017RUT3_9CLOT|nr:hydrogenase nickel incorporation protein HypB [Fervidicella metallireducens]EYE88376.1 hydantoin utilization protein B [Fervidicella metallireducens AeB]
MEIKVVKQILEWNEDCSNEIKGIFAQKGIYMINVMGSPGAGKTSLIVEMIKRLSTKYRVAVIEGDIAGQIDAEKIDSLGIPVVQLNTDGACHIEAMSIKHILQYFDLDNIDIIIVENIGNLVCPAEFNIGEDIRVAILSIPEGDDKIEKYPLMFSTSESLVLNKYDMIEHFDFDDKKVEEVTKDLNPNIEIFRISTKNQTGLEEFTDWLCKNIYDKIKK